ncbi:hypothetical protein EDB37_101222 [Vibrio crassostreae]|nr:hypothetical protein EDB37_101222 [Vibrio crassostreae]
MSKGETALWRLNRFNQMEENLAQVQLAQQDVFLGSVLFIVGGKR